MPPKRLPTLLTPALLSSIRGHPHLPRHSWYFVTGVTLSILNRPDEIANIFQLALEKGSGRHDSSPGQDEQLLMARKLREALIKAAPIGGLPKVCSGRVARVTNLHNAAITRQSMRSSLSNTLHLHAF